MHIDTVLLKVASRCNLDCTYCYVYHMGDESWRSLPKLMTGHVQGLVADQLRELRVRQGRPFSIVLHGGEPLLLGRERLERLFQTLRRQLGSDTGLAVQTNGVLLTDSVIDILEQYAVRVSVSIDGPPSIHDANRVDLKHLPTQQRVLDGIDRLRNRASGIFSGVLAVVDPYSDAEEVYQFFKDLQVPSVDFLYRDGNHTNLPFGKDVPESEVYGRWMAKILDRYLADAEPMRIRILDDMLKLLLGGVGVKEGIGLTDYGILVIDTDGSVKKNDTLKSSLLGDRFHSEWNLANDRLAEIVTSEEFRRYHLAQRPSSRICATCDFLNVCGGGMLTHRFKEGEGYSNPTVFCADQKFLIEHMSKCLASYQSTKTRVA